MKARYKKLLCAITLSVVTTSACADFYVIPVKVKMKNLLRVAKNGGDYSDPIQAMASIQGADSTNRYALYLEDDFNLTAPLHIKDNVDIYGNGHTLSGAVSTSDANTSAVVYGANASHLYNLTIVNRGIANHNYSVALLNDGNRISLENVHLTAKGGDTNIALLNLSSSDVSLHNSSIVLEACSVSCYGIKTTGQSKLTMADSALEISVSSLSSAIYGLYFEQSHENTVTSAGIIIYGGATGYALYLNYASVSLTGTTMETASTTWSFAAYLEQYATANLARTNISVHSATTKNTALFAERYSYITTQNSQFTGNEAIDAAISTDVIFTKSTLDGTRSSDATSRLTCVDTVDANNSILNLSCQ